MEYFANSPYYIAVITNISFALAIITMSCIIMLAAVSSIFLYLESKLYGWLIICFLTILCVASMVINCLLPGADAIKEYNQNKMEQVKK